MRSVEEKEGFWEKLDYFWKAKDSTIECEGENNEAIEFILRWNEAKCSKCNEVNRVMRNEEGIYCALHAGNQRFLEQ